MANATEALRKLQSGETLTPEEKALLNIGSASVADASKPKTDLFTGKYGVFEVLLDDPTYGEELRKIKEALKAGNQTLAEDLWNRSKWGRLDSDAQSRILTKLQNENLYKERYKSWLINIKKQLVSKGLSADDKTLEKYFLDGIDDTTILDELAGKIEPKTAGGEIADSLERLRLIARNNGFNLEKDFGTQLTDWMQRISRGEPIGNFERLIRAQAKLGLPEKVASLLDEGLDLANIYGPYRTRMANILEIPVDSIKLDDPVLRSAIGPDKEMSLYDFQRALRKDPRWQYTQQASQEVSNGVKQVLQDFGFMG